MGAYVHGESGTIMKTVVWGCGEKLHEIIDCFPALINRVDFFIDSNVTEFAGQKVYNCEVLRSIDSIRLVICVRSDEIRKLMVSPVINYDGRLLGCCKVINEDWKINVFEEGLQNAVNSEKYRNGILALLEKDTEPEADSPCGKCKNKKAKGFCLCI